MAVDENRLFVDSNFFIALFNPLDNLHKKAILISQKLVKENPRLFISNFIFLEVVTVLSQRINKKVAISFGQHLLKDRGVEIIHIDKRLNNLTWEIFQKVRKKNISFVDCSILVVMKEEGIKKLLTLDREDFAGLQRKFYFSFYS